MIKLTRLNGHEYYINSDLIETVEAMPDTMISTMDGKKYIVLEPVEKVIEAVIQSRVNIRRLAQTEKPSDISDLTQAE